jgi:hypothetical protein
MGLALFISTYHTRLPKNLAGPNTTPEFAPSFISPGVFRAVALSVNHILAPSMRRFISFPVMFSYEINMRLSIVERDKRPTFAADVEVTVCRSGMRIELRKWQYMFAVSTDFGFHDPRVEQPKVESR